MIVHTSQHGHHVEHRRVAYDHDAFIARVMQSSHPEVDYIASFQRGERIHHPAQRPGAPVMDT